MFSTRALLRIAGRSQPLDCIIVGAGVAGLQALNECLKAGVRAKCLERDARPGGKWSGHGIYECVQIQQHREDFFMPSMPWPDGTPAFVTRDDMVSVTDRYIAENKVAPHIECRTKVVSTTFDDTAGVWKTKTGAGTVWESRYLAWAVGTLGPPNFPKQVADALKNFEGDVVHSHAYFRPLAYEGMNVVVLGFGASSVEIAQDLARNGMCASVTLVAKPKVQADGMRRGQDWCLSRALPGMGSRFCSQGADGEADTLEARNDMVRAAMKQRHPKYPECMPAELRPTDKLEGKPVYPGMDGRPLGGRVIVSEGFLDCVSDGSVTCQPGYIGGSTAKTVNVVHNGDNVTLNADAVVVCTGYHSPTERIASAMTPSPKDCDNLYKGMWMPDVPNAALVGHVYGFVAVPPFAGIQAKYLARVVSGAESLPPSLEMKSWVESVQEKYSVTQRLTENPYFSELRATNLGAEVAARAPTGAGPPVETPALLSIAEPAAGALAASAAVVGLIGASNHRPGVAVLAAAAAAAATALSRRTSGIAGGLPSPVGSVLGALGLTRDNSVETAAAEALTFLDESQNGAELGGKDLTGDISVLAVGPSGADVQAALATKLRPAERARVRNVGPVEEPIGPWAAAPSRAMDLVICNGALNEVEAPTNAFALEALRVLKPGGHAVVMLREGTPRTAKWLSLFDEHEKLGAKAGGLWRLVHKTAPHAHAMGGAYRQYIYRAR